MLGWREVGPRAAYLGACSAKKLQRQPRFWKIIEMSAARAERSPIREYGPCGGFQACGWERVGLFEVVGAVTRAELRCVPLATPVKYGGMKDS